MVCRHPWLYMGFESAKSTFSKKFKFSASRADRARAPLLAPTPPSPGGLDCSLSPPTSYEAPRQNRNAVRMCVAGLCRARAPSDVGGGAADGGEVLPQFCNHELTCSNHHMAHTQKTSIYSRYAE